MCWSATVGKELNFGDTIRLNLLNYQRLARFPARIKILTLNVAGIVFELALT